MTGGLPDIGHDGAHEPVFVDYFDGASAVPHRVELRLGSTVLTVILPDGATLLWRYEDVHSLPDQAGRTGIALRYRDGQERLYLGDGQADLADELRDLCPPKSPEDIQGQTLRRLIGYSVLAAGSVLVILFLLIPLMASQLAAILPPAGEKALGDETFQQIRVALDRTGGDGLVVCENPDGRAALDKMSARLTKHTDLPFALQLHVLDSELVNAFALPGGHVVLFRGLIDEAGHPDEVSAVLAHEMGHVFYRDATVGALRSAGSIGVLGLLFGDFAGGTVALLLANQLINASYSQDAEARADTFAHRLLLDASLPPRALATFFERLQQEGGEAPALVEHFLSHPALGDRLAAARAAQEVQSGPVSPSLSASDWRDLRAICR